MLKNISIFDKHKFAKHISHGVADMQEAILLTCDPKKKNQKSNKRPLLDTYDFILTLWKDLCKVEWI